MPINEDWFNDTITVDPWTGSRGQAGDPIFSGVQRTQSGRVEPRIEIVRANNGEERVTSHWIATPTAIGDQDRIWIPGDDTSKTSSARFPIRVDTVKTKDGSIDHYEIWL